MVVAAVGTGVGARLGGVGTLAKRINTNTDQGKRRVEQNCVCLSGVVKLLSRLWTAGCLDAAPACLASARCCSEITHAGILEELKFSHAYPHTTLISKHSLARSSLFFPTIYFGGFVDSRVQRDGVGVHL